MLGLSWNWDFLKNTDSSDQRPESAGLGIAILGSAYMMFLVLIMCVPVGVAASIYLEEFAPKNRWTDLIEVNVSNLAAVPSIQIPQAQDMVVDAVGLSAGRGRPEWIIIRDGGELRVQPRRVLTCSSMMLVYEAVLAGAGMGILPVWLVQDDVARGRLRVWGDMAGEGISAWVLHPPAHLTSPRVKAFVDAIVAAFRDGPATGQ